MRVATNNIPLYAATRREAGFSLIDVLIAVVVLSVGLLALSLLQLQLVRGFATSKTQSQAMALAQQTLEELRGFTSTKGTTNSYECIGTAACQPSSTVTVGANTFTRTVKVKRYVRATNSTTSTFVDASTLSQVPAIGTNEYKYVNVEVDWTNESGAVTTTNVSDVISVTSPTDSINTLAAATAGRRPPQVWIDPKKFAPGVIPIALSTTQSAAASDPQPETFSTGHITTRFSVLNYNTQPNASGLVLLNKQFDFAVTSCTCNTSVVSTLINQAYGPTYWNGTQYISPAAVPVAKGDPGKITGTDPVSNGNPSNSSQDPILCSACCRDHHDATGQKVKFDPFRPTAETDDASGDHLHYDTDSKGNLLTTAITGSSNEYYETCRFVRVDGMNRVSTDARAENHIVIAPIDPIEVTKQSTSCDPSGDSITSSTNCFDHAVDSTTAGTYASFVTDYVNAFYSAFQGAASYPLKSDGITPAIGDLLVDSSGNPSTLAKKPAYSALLNPLGNPTPAQTVLSIDVNDIQYLEGRGVYVDYIGDETKAALNCVGSANPDCITFASSSVLQVLPFVAVNLTNLDSWRRSINGTAINVTNSTIPTNGTFDPFIIGYTFDRGTVTGLASGSDRVVAQARPGNAGLIDSLSVTPSYPFEAYNCVTTNTPVVTQSPCAADPPGTTAMPAAYDTSASSATGPRFISDRQPYTVSGTTSNLPFSVSISDHSVSGNTKSNLGNPVAISVTAPSLNPSTLANCTLGAGNKQPYTCYSTSSATTLTIQFSSYNTQVSCKPSKNTTCPQPPQVNDYQICSLTGLPNANFATLSSPTVVNAGSLNEQTSFTLTLNPNNGQSITDIINSMSSSSPVTANFYLQSQNCP